MTGYRDDREAMRARIDDLEGELAGRGDDPLDVTLEHELDADTIETMAEWLRIHFQEEGHLVRGRTTSWVGRGGARVDITVGAGLTRIVGRTGPTRRRLSLGTMATLLVVPILVLLLPRLVRSPLVVALMVLALGVAVLRAFLVTRARWSAQAERADRVTRAVADLERLARKAAARAEHEPVEVAATAGEVPADR